MPSAWILQMHLRNEITHVPSAGEATALDDLLWTVLWRPLGLPRDCRGTFALAGDETELIARDGARIVGGLVAVQRGLSFTEIRHLAIDPQYQGRGIGQALLRETERMARERRVARQVQKRDSSPAWDGLRHALCARRQHSQTIPLDTLFALASDRPARQEDGT